MDCKKIFILSLAMWLMFACKISVAEKYLYLLDGGRLVRL